MRTASLAALLLLAAAGCGSPASRQACSAPGQCPAGQYCALPEGVCWDDAFAPAIDQASVSCAAPCLRDGVLDVTVAARDDGRVASVRVALDVAPDRPVTLPKVGTGWTGQVALAGLPFPFFERAVTATVTVRDEAGNEQSTTVSGASAPVVTRLRWAVDMGGQVAGLAVYPDGGLLVSSSGPDRLSRLDQAGVKVWGVSPGSDTLGVASLGASAAWVGNFGGRVYAIGADGAVLNGAGCDTTGEVSGPPAVSAAGDVAFAASKSGALFAVDTSSRCQSFAVFDAYNASPVVQMDGTIHGASSSTAATLRSFSAVAVGFRDNWTGAPPAPQVGLDVAAPPAVDALGRVWTISTDGKLNATTPGGATNTVKTIGGSGTGPIILSDGSVVVGDGGRVVRRITPAGAVLWTTPDLLATPATPLVLAGGDAQLLVPTALGTLHALRSSDGAEVWSTTLAPNAALRPGNVFAPPGTALSTGYFPAANGRLYAVILDGRLDAAAPWPKAFHDPRNTGNAATPLP